MSNVVIAVVGLIGTVIAALLGYLAAILARQSARESNATTDWAKMFEANEKQLERMQADIDRLDTKLGHLDEALTAEKRLRRSAFDYIRILLRWIEAHMPGQMPPSVPELLKEEL
ncbi:hypothetical protein [Rhodococcus koreensis]|uniref:hypothetical protein n=1 Tax=Rhodococcus koreensis TaxID=99653 RepID=UPI0036DB42E2